MLPEAVAITDRLDRLKLIPANVTLPVTVKPHSAVIGVPVSHINGVRQDFREDTLFSHNDTIRLCQLTSLNAWTLWGGATLYLTLNDAAAALQAVMHFNARDASIVSDMANSKLKKCNVKFTLEFFDTELSPMTANTILTEDLVSRTHSLKTPRPCAILGAARSAVSGPLSIMSSVYGLPVISHASTSSNLDNRDQFRYFGRTIPTNRGDATAAVAYFRDLHVTHIAVLYVRDDYGTAYYSELAAAAGASDPPIKVVSVSYDVSPGSGKDTRAAMNKLRQTGFNYFFGIISPGGVAEIFREAHLAGIMGPGKFWMFGDGALEILKDDFVYNMSTEADLVEATNGVAVILMDVKMNEKFVADEGLKEFLIPKVPKGLKIEQDSFNFHWDAFSYMQYDAVMALGLAACETKRDEFFSGPDLFKSFTKTQFDGASGHVMFNEMTGTRAHDSVTFKITNVLANPPDQNGAVTFRSVEAFHQVIANNTNGTSLKWSKTENFTYADGSARAPPVLPEKHEKTNMIGTVPLVVGLALAVIVLLMSVICAGWTFRYRRSHIVRCSQPEFLFLLCLGAFVMACSVIPMSFQEPLPRDLLDTACMATPWLFQMGFVVSFSALFSKTSLMNKIYLERRFRRMKVNVFNVFVPFILCFTASVILLLSWSIVAPLSWHRTYSLKSYDSFGRLVDSYGSCYSDGYLAFFALIIGLDVGVLLLAIIEIYRARWSPCEYNESKYIMISIASILQSFVIGVPVLVPARKNPTATFLIRSSLVALVCVAVLFPLFVPKEYARRKATRERDEWHESRRLNGLDKKSGLRTWSSIQRHYRCRSEKPHKNLDEQKALGASSMSKCTGTHSEEPWVPKLNQLAL